MKNLLLFAALGVLGYFAYREWLPAAPAASFVTATPTPAPTPTPRPVDFAVKSAVKSLYEEWKRRVLSDPDPHGAAAIDMPQKLTEIRRRLFMERVHTEDAMMSAMATALQELGVAPREADYVVKKILEEVEAEKQAKRAAAEEGSSAAGLPPGGIGGN